MDAKMRAMLAMALMGLAGLSGCRMSDDYYNQKGEPVADKPSKADAPRVERTAPASTDGMVRTTMAYPTGNPSTSALLLERMAPAEVIGGQEFAYEFKVTNLTSMELKDVALSDACASGFTVISSDPASTGKSPNLAWALGTFAPGQSKMVKLMGKANTNGGVLTSCATVSYNSLLCISTNVVQPGLKVAVAAPDMKMMCDEVCVDITVSNPGTGVARNTKVTYAVPAGWTAKTPIMFDAGDLKAGEVKTGRVCLTPGKTGSFNSTASAAADGKLTAASNTAVTTIKKPVLAITAKCPTGTTMIGRNMSFGFTVKNTGDANSANTMLTAPLPAGTSFVSADMGGAPGTNSISWNLGDLKAGESKTVMMTVKNNGAGTVAASASVLGTCADIVSANCTASVEGVPDIGTLLTDDDGVILIGDPHTFRYEAKNQGQINLTNLKVVFKFDEGMDFVSSTASVQGKVTGKTVEFNLGTLKPGDKIAFTITGKGTKEGNLLLTSETSASETKRSNRNDEQVNYITR